MTWDEIQFLVDKHLTPIQKKEFEVEFDFILLKRPSNKFKVKSTVKEDYSIEIDYFNRKLVLRFNER